MTSILLADIAALYGGKGQEHFGVDLLIEGNRISAVGKSIQAPHAKRISCSGKLVYPGFINTHHHFFQSLTRCLPGAQNAGLFEWLGYHYPIWSRIDEEMFKAAFDLAIAELLLTGCTTTTDHHYLFPSAVGADLMALEIQSAKELGIRFCATRGSMSLGKSGGGLPPDSIVEDDDKILEHCESCITMFHDPDPFAMCQVHLAPCSPFNVTRNLMIRTAELAKKNAVRLHTHLAETKDEDRYCRQIYNCSPLEWIEDCGWLENELWLAHGIHFSDSELDKLAKHQTGISFCPSSNMRLGSGIARVPEMIEKQVPVGLAVDGSASNDSGNMLAEVRQAMLLCRVKSGPAAMTARGAIDLATSGSASLLGRSTLGTIAPGQAADITILDLDRLDYSGAGDPIAAPLFCGHSDRVWGTIVNGRIVVEDGELLTGSEEAIKRNAQRQSKRLMDLAGF